MSDVANEQKVCRNCGGIAFQPKGRCIACAKKAKSEWTAKNVDRIAAYRAANRERDRLKEAEYRRLNAEKIRVAQLTHIASDPVAYKQKRRAYYEANVEREKARAKAFYEQNKPRMLELAKQWKANHPEVVKQAQKRSKEKVRGTAVGRLAHNVSARIRSALSSGGYTKQSKAREILGCDWDFMKAHIERQFLAGMCWEKLGSEIHIDHIVPIDAAETEQDVLLLSHFTNLRPMWAGENIRKSAKRIFLL